jgi:hypothetical protein
MNPEIKVKAEDPYNTFTGTTPLIEGTFEPTSIITASALDLGELAATLRFTIDNVEVTIAPFGHPEFNTAFMFKMKSLTGGTVSMLMNAYEAAGGGSIECGVDHNETDEKVSTDSEA